MTKRVNSMSKLVFSVIFIIPILMLSVIDNTIFRLLGLTVWVVVAFFLIQPFIYKKLNK
ncbi:hypothetical protein SAMN04488134_106118 [Amphibacillus marinus]|uniref:Uncharacterized protein n=1 Tax=Amphibacillus marinus TaxID=872970 RepID=A0A1H8NVJ5_9BACI|nr:hypothetical protein SAMN04488134_106118 [Amphibacillus marinus]